MGNGVATTSSNATVPNRAEVHEARSERTMKRRLLLLLLATLLPSLVCGRAVRIYGVRTLIAESHLAFVGRVKAVEPSGITTTFSYPTCKGVTFEWLNTTVEVVEPIKGVQRGDLVKTAMLSVHAVEIPAVSVD